MPKKDLCDPPSELFRFDGGVLWAGRRRFDVATNSMFITISREDLNEAAKIIWMQGVNFKRKEVHNDLRRAIRGFDEITNMLPVDDTTPIIWPTWRGALRVFLVISAVIVVFGLAVNYL